MPADAKPGMLPANDKTYRLQPGARIGPEAAPPHRHDGGPSKGWGRLGKVMTTIDALTAASRRPGGPGLRAWCVAWQLGLGLFVWLASVAMVHAAEAPRKVALVVGNGAYASGGALPNALNDAEDLCANLRALGFEAICATNLKTRREFKDRVFEFSKRLGRGTIALFYYAGHGLQLDGENYLVPTEAKLSAPPDIEDETISLRYVMAQVDQAGSEFSMFMLDACRNNPWSRGFRNVSRGLAGVTEAPVGSIVLFATAANDVAADGDGRNGMLTKHVLEHLRRPGLTVEQMIKQVSLGVQRESFAVSGRRQTPFLYSSFTGQFCFADCGGGPEDLEIARLRQERDRLEAAGRALAAERSEQERTIAQLTAAGKARQAELEEKIKAAEQRSVTDRTPPESLTRELNGYRRQIAEIEEERRTREAARRQTDDELRRLREEAEVMVRKLADAEKLSKRVAELEREKADRERDAKKDGATNRGTKPDTPHGAALPPAM